VYGMRRMSPIKDNPKGDSVDSDYLKRTRRSPLRAKVFDLAIRASGRAESFNFLSFNWKRNIVVLEVTKTAA